MHLGEARTQIEHVMEGLRHDVALSGLEGRELADVNEALEQTRLRALAFLLACCPSTSKMAMLAMIEHAHAQLHAVVTSSKR